MHHTHTTILLITMEKGATITQNAAIANRRRLHISTYNIRDGRAEGLLSAIRVLAQEHEDVAILTETKLTNGIYPREAPGYKVAKAWQKHSGAFFSIRRSLFCSTCFSSPRFYAGHLDCSHVTVSWGWVFWIVHFVFGCLASFRTDSRADPDAASRKARIRAVRAFEFFLPPLCKSLKAWILFMKRDGTSFPSWLSVFSYVSLSSF